MYLRRVLVTLLDPILLLWCTTALVAQLNRGAIEGNVTDPHGLAMSGVAVTITSVDTNVATTTKTNSVGYYRVEALVPGTYRAHFIASGFSSLEISAIEVLCCASQPG